MSIVKCDWCGGDGKSLQPGYRCVQCGGSGEMIRVVTREQARDMAEAHAEGLHNELPRQFCPECEGRELSSYPPAKKESK